MTRTCTDSTGKLYKRALKLRNHRINMVEFRKKKKEGFSSMQSDHRRLERVMKRNLEVIRNQNYLDGGALAVLRGLIVEKEALRNENMALCEQVKKHKTFHKALTLGEESENTILPVGNDKGWWVHFANASPSFYFHPFSAEEAHTAADPLDPEFIAALPPESNIGTFLGWSIRRHFCSKTLISRVHVSKRVFCSLDRAFKVVVEKEGELRPLLKTPAGWNFTQRHEVSAQVLQEIDPYTRVMVHDISGCNSVRYVFVARSAHWEVEPTKRKVGFSMMIIDSDANKLSRDSGTDQDNVQWMTQGWAYFTLTEVNDGVVDVEYRHCAECSSETHAGGFDGAVGAVFSTVGAGCDASKFDSVLKL